jgi:hypothetical protein
VGTEGLGGDAHLRVRLAMPIVPHSHYCHERLSRASASLDPSRPLCRKADRYLRNTGPDGQSQIFSGARVAPIVGLEKSVGRCGGLRAQVCRRSLSIDLPHGCIVPGSALDLSLAGTGPPDTSCNPTGSVTTYTDTVTDLLDTLCASGAFGPSITVPMDAEDQTPPDPTGRSKTSECPPTLVFE